MSVVPWRPFGFVPNSLLISSSCHLLEAFVTFSVYYIQAFLGEMENRRQARRPFRYGLPQNQADRSDNPGSSSRGVRRPRSSALTRMLNPQSAANMDERRVQFPAAMALESVSAGSF